MLLIPYGVELAGVKAFADAFASTTAGPEKRIQSVETRAWVNNIRLQPIDAVDGRSLAAVAAGKYVMEATSVLDVGAEPKEGTWSVVWGLQPEQWKYQTLHQIKMVPGVRCVLPVMACGADLLVLFESDRSKIPRAASIMVEGINSRFFF